MLTNASSSDGGTGSSLPSSVLSLATAASVVATALSLWSITLQLKNYRKPLLQRWVVRILVMVPIFALASLIALYSLDAAFLIDLIRDLYEAFSIYCFFSLLLTFLGGERSLLILLHGREPTPHPWPVCLVLRPLDISDPFSFLFLKRGILQYVQIKPVLAVITILLKATGTYAEGQLNVDAGYTYISVAYNISVTVSLYCLAMFWVCTTHDLKPFRPMPKFICVKALIFFTFWQGLAISFLVRLRIIHSDRFTSENFSIAIQDACLCLEMPFFAVLHLYAFSHKDYLPSKSRTYSGRLPFMHAFRDSLLGYKDVLDDSLTTFRGTGFSYRTFEPAEGGLHSATGDARAKRARAGLRYANGGKTKYWLPMPGADETEAYGRRPSKVAYAPLPPGYTATDATDRFADVLEHPFDVASPGTAIAEMLTSPVQTIGRKIREKRDARRGYAPIAPEQAAEVVHDDSRYRTQGRTDTLGFMRAAAAGSVPFAGLHGQQRPHTHRTPSSPTLGHEDDNLEFPEVTEEEQQLYDDARQLEFGDYNYPVLDASKEEARRAMREIETDIVKGRRTHWQISKAADQRAWKAAQTPPQLRPTKSYRSASSSSDVGGQRNTIKGKGKQTPDGCIDLLVEDEAAEAEAEELERERVEPTFRTGIPKKVFKRTYGTMEAGPSNSSRSRPVRATPSVSQGASGSKLPRVQPYSSQDGYPTEIADAGPSYSKLNQVTKPYPVADDEDREHGEYAAAVAPPEFARLHHLDNGRPFDDSEEEQRRQYRQRVASGEESFNPWGH